MAEKLIADIKVRCTEQLSIDLMKLAAAHDRTLSDYCRAVLMDRAYGHARTMACGRLVAQTVPCPHLGNAE